MGRLWHDGCHWQTGSARRVRAQQCLACAWRRALRLRQLCTRLGGRLGGWLQLLRRHGRSWCRLLQPMLRRRRRLLLLLPPLLRWRQWELRQLGRRMGQCEGLLLRWRARLRRRPQLLQLRRQQWRLQLRCELVQLG